MKKISTIVMALVMVLAMSQCKKNEQNTSENQDEAVTITLNVNGASTGSATDGSRVIVNPATGTVDFENGDQIIVASGGKYVGALTYNGNLFTGAISNATEGYPLQFYFLGNVTPAETLTSGVTESCSVVISDQTEHLPVISTAPSNENYAASTTDYTAHLLNKCALVKFNVTTVSEAAICVTGFNNKVTVNFMDNTLTNSQESNGVITLPAGNGEKWAILLPQEAVEAGAQGSAYSQDGVYIGIHGAVPAITENGYLTIGIQVAVTTEVNQGEVPTGAINGKFTINANGDQVYFSQGNLQYQASTDTWRFAENQYDIIGNANSNISPTYDGWIDLFGWGTSGYDDKYPWMTSEIETDYGDNQNNIAYTEYDWGQHNPISNGGNQAGLWRTLSSAEMGYVVYQRNNADNLYAMGLVNGWHGLIILPDDCVLPESIDFTPAYKDFTNTVNSFSLEQWNQMEAIGAVFLPVAGVRQGIQVSQVDESGYYWSTDILSPEDGAREMWFGRMYIYYNPGIGGSFSRHNGISVRLVHDAE